MSDHQAVHVDGVRKNKNKNILRKILELFTNFKNDQRRCKIEETLFADETLSKSQQNGDIRGL